MSAPFPSQKPSQLAPCRRPSIRRAAETIPRAGHTYSNPLAVPLRSRLLLITWALISTLNAVDFRSPPPTLPSTQPLDWQGDIASNLVAGVDRFLLKQIEAAAANREQFWHRDRTSARAYSASIATNRVQLRQILGIRDVRPPATTIRFQEGDGVSSLIYDNEDITIRRVSWSALDEVDGEGLLLSPREGTPTAWVIAVPDADVSPEALAGLLPGVAKGEQYARRLAEAGCRVLVPRLISRAVGEPKSSQHSRGQALSNREYLYRPAFELGRHIIGFELQKLLAAVDHLSLAPNSAGKIGIVGWGEGGMLALYAAALDERIEACVVSGYFEKRDRLWEQPIDRNVFGLLKTFGDAELAAMVAPRSLVIEVARGPSIRLDGKGGGAPAELRTPDRVSVREEYERAKRLAGNLGGVENLKLSANSENEAPCLRTETLESFYRGLKTQPRSLKPVASDPATSRASISDVKEREHRQMRQMEQFTQRLLADSASVRSEFMRRLDTSNLEKYAETSAPYRRFFYDQVIGRFSDPVLAANPRSRKVYDEATWTGYEVVLDVYPDVFAYGLLLLPKDLKENERRPVVVCQHGLEGRPQHTIGKEGFGAYSAFSARLAERGFVVFAPQNLYIFTDRFRSLQRKANTIQKTLFSIITPQHQQIVDWLKTQSFVDPARIGFYGLSYGGKTAMRVPALVTDYCLSICSADFNEWVWKNASTRSPYSYTWSGEYEIFEFDLGSTFNYAEMAALIAPRPFMVERGHFDGVAPDETVGYEYAKVRHLYAARLGIGDRTEIEWFVGPHTIHGQGTYAFLHKHLRWPAP